MKLALALASLNRKVR